MWSGLVHGEEEGTDSSPTPQPHLDQGQETKCFARPLLPKNIEEKKSWAEQKYFITSLQKCDEVPIIHVKQVNLIS